MLTPSSLEKSSECQLSWFSQVTCGWLVSRDVLKLHGKYIFMVHCEDTNIWWFQKRVVWERLSLKEILWSDMQTETGKVFGAGQEGFQKSQEMKLKRWFGKSLLFHQPTKAHVKKLKFLSCPKKQGTCVAFHPPWDTVWRRTCTTCTRWEVHQIISSSKLEGMKLTQGAPARPRV